MGLWPMCFVFVVLVISAKFEQRSVHAKGKSKDEMNIGTVLFDKGISSKHCWSNDEMIILNSRKMFQDLLPKIKPLNTRDDKYIGELLRYFSVCLEYVSSMSSGKTKRLMLKSLADAMGGYLHAYVAPITKVSFYAGQIEYCNAEKVFRLLAELKHFLSSDGTGWRKPVELEMFINVTPIVVDDDSREDARAACDRLILNPAMASDAHRGRSETNDGDEVNWDNNQDAVYDRSDNEEETTRMHLPYFDSNVQPNSIAVPFRDRNLWSLHEEDSVAILAAYYSTSASCISTNERALARFNRDFYQWLLESVYPRLNDDKWYPAFGGVLRIIAYLRDEVEGVPPAKNASTAPGPFAAASGLLDSLGTLELVVIAISSAALVWILVGLSLVCYRHCRKRQCDSPRSDSSFAMLYKNEEFDAGRSTCSRKSVAQRVREWWRQRFKTCPGGCDRTEETETCVASVKYYSRDSLCANASRRSFKRRKKRFRSVSATASPSSSPCAHYANKRYHYSSDMSSSSSESSFR